MISFLQQLSLWTLPLLAAVVFHEVAHGYMAYRLGDLTAARSGRLTLNPFAHIDLFGTVILPGLLLVMGAPFLFGYAKPVPVNYLNLRNPRTGMVLVAIAGPLTNLLLALCSSLVLKGLLTVQLPAQWPGGDFLLNNLSVIALMAQKSVVINVVLAVFNILPIPPLDGGRVATGFLPREQAILLARLEPFGMLVIVVLLAAGVLGTIMGPMIQLFLHILL